MTIELSKKTFVAFILAVALVWVGHVEYRLAQHTPADQWIFTQTSVKDAEDNPLTRGQLLDAIIVNALQNSAPTEEVE